MNFLPENVSVSTFEMTTLSLFGRAEQGDVLKGYPCGIAQEFPTDAAKQYSNSNCPFFNQKIESFLLNRKSVLTNRSMTGAQIQVPLPLVSGPQT